MKVLFDPPDLISQVAWSGGVQIGSPDSLASRADPMVVEDNQAVLLRKTFQKLNTADCRDD